MQFILDSQARAEVRAEKADARMEKTDARVDRMEKRFDRKIDAITKLIRQGMKSIAEIADSQKELLEAQKDLAKSHKELAEAQKKTGRSQQHPTLAHFLVGQLFPPWNGGSRRPPAPLARCCDAAGTVFRSPKRRADQFTRRPRALASGTSDWSARPAEASNAGEPLRSAATPSSSR